MLTHVCGPSSIIVWDCFSDEDFGLVWWEIGEEQVRGDTGKKHAGSEAVCCYPSLLAECSSSWDQLQAMPFSLWGSVWGQWLGNASPDIPKLCYSVFSLPFVIPSGLSTPTLRQASHRGRFHVGFIGIEEEADLRSDGSVFRVTGQDCGSVQEEESCNLGKS